MNRLERVKQLRQKRIPKPLPIPEKGDRGEKGDIGLPGINGKDGRDGKDGLPGARGKQGLPGKRGEKGKPGRDGIDGKSIVWRGDWSNGTSYSINDAVSCFGSAFICTKDHKANNKTKPSVGENWHTYWAVLAERGEQGPAGAPGVNGQQGPAGAPGTVPDEAFTITTGLRICDWSFGGFTAMDLGTNGSVAMKWTRIGRDVIGWIKIKIDTDYTTPTGFIVVLHPDDFPVVPKVESATSGYPMPGGFGALYRGESSGGAADGFRIGMAPIVQDIGIGQSLMMFFKTGSETGIAATIDNLWSPATNNPVAASNLGGTSYFGNFRYEAATAA